MALFCCLRFGDMLRVTRFFGHSSHYLQRLSATAEQCAVVCIAVSGIFTRREMINHLPRHLIGTRDLECVAASCHAKVALMAPTRAYRAGQSSTTKMPS